MQVVEVPTQLPDGWRASSDSRRVDRVPRTTRAGSTAVSPATATTTRAQGMKMNGPSAALKPQ